MFRSVIFVPHKCITCPTFDLLGGGHPTLKSRVFMCVSHPTLLQSSQRFIDAIDKFVYVFKVFCHLSGENHVDNSLPKRAVFISVTQQQNGQFMYVSIQ